MKSEDLKKEAIRLGADIVGIGDISLFDGTPKEKDPRYIAPSAKSIICLGFRMLRGTFRGIESGTQFYQLPTMGVENIDVRYAPSVLRRLSCYIEDQGYEGVALMPELDRKSSKATECNPEMEQTHIINARPVSSAKPAPDVIIDHNQGAYICGMGEIGMGGFFLTSEFGPLQRFAFILTDAELEFDSIRSSDPICDKCGICIKSCPGSAISSTKKTTKNWAGEKITHNEFNSWQCSAFYAGAFTAENPFAPDDILDQMPNGKEIAEGKRNLTHDEVIKVKKLLAKNYGGVGSNYGACICGQACKLECMIHLQETKRLTKQFKNPFRNNH